MRRLLPSLAFAVLIAAALATTQQGARRDAPAGDAEALGDLLEEATYWVHHAEFTERIEALRSAFFASSERTADPDFAARAREGYELLATLVPSLEVALTPAGARLDAQSSARVVAGRRESLVVRLAVPPSARGPLAIRGTCATGLRLEPAELQLGGEAVHYALLAVEADRPGTHRLELQFEGGQRSARLAVELEAVPSGRLSGSLFEAAGEAERIPVPARVTVTGADGRYYLPAHLDGQRPSRRDVAFGYFYADGELELVVPAGPVQVRAERGFEYRPATRSTRVPEDGSAAVELELKRWVDMVGRGWWSVDSHLHYVSLSWYEEGDWDVLDVQKRAEDVNVGHVLPLMHWYQHEGEARVTSNLHPPRQGVLEPYSSGRYVTAVGEEMRSHLYGHLIFWNVDRLIEPVSTGSIAGPEVLDYPSNLQMARAARARGGLVSAAHDVVRDVPVLAAHGALDLVDIQGPLRWYELLNSGFRLPAEIGSDYPSNRMGFVRAYVYTGESRFAWDGFVDALKRGRTFVSSGAMLHLEADGALPGDVLQVQPGRPVLLTLDVAAEWLEPLGRLEILHNGEVVHVVEPAAPRRELRFQGELVVPGKGWIAARCSPEQEGNWWRTPGVAHTSPIYLDDGTGPYRADRSAQILLDATETLAAEVAQYGWFATEEDRAEVLAEFEQAAEQYRAQLERR